MRSQESAVDCGTRSFINMKLINGGLCSVITGFYGFAVGREPVVTEDNPIAIKLRRILLIIKLLRITNRLSLKA